MCLHKIFKLICGCNISIGQCDCNRHQIHPHSPAATPKWIASACGLVSDWLLLFLMSLLSVEAFGNLATIQMIFKTTFGDYREFLQRTNWGNNLNVLSYWKVILGTSKTIYWGPQEVVFVCMGCNFYENNWL